MKKIGSILIIFSILLNASARAEGNEINQEMSFEQIQTLQKELNIETYSPSQNEEPINKDSLRILGSGLKLRGKNEWLVLGCYTENCDTLRFALMTENAAAFIGSAIKMPTAPTEALKEKGLKVLVDQYFILHQTTETQNKCDHRSAKVLFLTVGVAVLIALTGPAAGPGLAIVAAEMGGTLLGGMLLLTRPSFYDHLQNGTLIDVQLTDRNGWNWSLESKKISEKNFNLILGQILNGKEIPFGEENSIPYSKTRKIYNRKQHLRKRGVVFDTDSSDDELQLIRN